MRFVKCKNEAEKIKAIADYCKEQIERNNFEIEGYKSERVSILDYSEEINELEIRNSRFETIINIIEADELTSVMIL